MSADMASEASSVTQSADVTTTINPDAEFLNPAEASKSTSELRHKGAASSEYTFPFEVDPDARPRSVVVRGLSHNVTDQHIREIVSHFGEVQRVLPLRQVTYPKRLAMDANSWSFKPGQRLQEALIEFTNADDAERACAALSGGVIDGLQIQLQCVANDKGPLYFEPANAQQAKRAERGRQHESKQPQTREGGARGRSVVGTRTGDSASRGNYGRDRDRDHYDSRRQGRGRGRYEDDYDDYHETRRSRRLPSRSSSRYRDSSRSRSYSRSSSRSRSRSYTPSSSRSRSRSHSRRRSYSRSRSRSPRRTRSYSRSYSRYRSRSYSSRSRSRSPSPRRRYDKRRSPSYSRSRSRSRSRPRSRSRRTRPYSRRSRSSSYSRSRSRSRSSRYSRSRDRSYSRSRSRSRSRPRASRSPAEANKGTTK